MSIKFSANEIRFIALFENMTGAMVKDCIIDDEHGKVTFVVKNGDMGLAIGKGGQNVRLASLTTGWKIDIKDETAAYREEISFKPNVYGY